MLRTRRADVPPMLEALVMKCLIKDPNERFQRADEILLALEAMGTPSLPGFGGAAPAVQALLARTDCPALAGSRSSSEPS